MARLLPPESASVETVSRDLCISVMTLERWTAPARFEAVLVTASMDEASKSAWCRENGVYSQELEQWRLAATQALADPGETRASPSQTKADRRRIKELERELHRKEKALAEAAALLVLREKLAAIFPTDKDEDA